MLERQQLDAALRVASADVVWPCKTYCGWSYQIEDHLAYKTLIERRPDVEDVIISQSSKIVLHKDELLQTELRLQAWPRSRQS